jgi:hypothetical protein
MSVRMTAPGASAPSSSGTGGCHEANSAQLFPLVAGVPAGRGGRGGVAVHVRGIERQDRSPPGPQVSAAPTGPGGRGAMNRQLV